jgi:hypothetical protein
MTADRELLLLLEWLLDECFLERESEFVRERQERNTQIMHANKCIKIQITTKKKSCGENTSFFTLLKILIYCRESTR